MGRAGRRLTWPQLPVLLRTPSAPPETGTLTKPGPQSFAGLQSTRARWSLRASCKVHTSLCGPLYPHQTHSNLASSCSFRDLGTRLIPWGFWFSFWNMGVVTLSGDSMPMQRGIAPMLAHTVTPLPHPSAAWMPMEVRAVQVPLGEAPWLLTQSALSLELLGRAAHCWNNNFWLSSVWVITSPMIGFPCSLQRFFRKYQAMPAGLGTWRLARARLGH